VSDFIEPGDMWHGHWIREKHIIDRTRVLWPCTYCDLFGADPIEIRRVDVWTHGRPGSCRVCHGEGRIEITLTSEPIPCSACDGYGRTAGAVTDPDPGGNLDWGPAYRPMFCETCQGLGIVRESGPIISRKKQGLLHRLFNR
jgi:DnaJ-class molecular chaperone